MLCQEYEKQVPEHEPDVSFTAKDYKDVVPHDDDPMVVTLQIFKWDVKGWIQSNCNLSEARWRGSPASKSTSEATLLLRQRSVTDLMPKLFAYGIL
jgi:hypothetical protein